MQIKSSEISTVLTVALACTLSLTGCFGAAKKHSPKITEEKPKAAEEPKKAEVPPVDVTEASLRGSDYVQTAEIEAIHFDYDSADLGETALATLKKNADYLKAHADLDVRIAGYCDDRGTVEYNLALGQKRAKEVHDYYVRLGVTAANLATISYGKEQPVCSDSTEECWSLNRRAETTVRSRMPAPPAAEAVPSPAPAQ